ncbi:MAG: hypothetical protein ACLFM0_03115 [Spirochaetales bacterium]
MEHLKLKWLVFAIGGLILIGAGVSITGQAIIVKSQAESAGEWFAMGTAGLVVLNSGVSVFGQSIVYRIQQLRG